MTVKTKEDCPLHCGYEAIDDFRYYWRDNSNDFLINTWLVCSIPALLAVACGIYWSLVPDNIFVLMFLAVVIVFGIIGAVLDAAFIFAAIDIWRFHQGLVMPKWVISSAERYARIASLAAKIAAVKFWELGSPVLLVTLLTAYRSNELGALSGNALSLFWIVCAACLPGCWHDLKYMFGDIVKALWIGRDSNPLGFISRTVIRGIGIIYIAAGRCKTKKAHVN